MGRVRMTIPGVGVVNVDEAFLDLPPEQQAEYISQLTDEVRGGGKPRGQGTSGELERILLDTFPNAQVTGKGRTVLRNAEVGGATNSYHLDDQGLDIAPIPGATIDDVREAFARQGIQLDEALDEGNHYHIAWSGERPNAHLPPIEPEKPREPIRQTGGQTTPASFGNFKRVGTTGDGGFGSDLDAFLMGAGDSASFGTLDAIYAHLGALVPGLANASIWDKLGNGEHRSYSDAVDLNRMDAHGTQDRLRDDHPLSTIGGTLAGGLAPLGSVGAPARLAKALKGGTGTAKAALDGALTGGTYAGLYGFGNSRGDFAKSVADGLADVPLGAAVGGTLGAAVPAINLVKTAQARKFVESQVRDNPYASVEAEIVRDLDQIISDVTNKAEGRKALDRTHADRTIYSRINRLEKSYLPNRELRALDIAPSTKAKLRQAIDDRHVISTSDVNALRGTPEGDFVADRLVKARMLRAIVPEAVGGARAAEKSATRVVGEAAATAAAAGLAGPKGAAAVRLATALLDKRAPVDGVSAAVDLARAKAKLAPRFAEVAERVGPSPATLSTERLAPAITEGQDAAYLAKQAEKRQAAKDAMSAVENRRVGVQNDLDDIRPGGGYRGMIYDQTGLLPSGQDTAALKLLADGKLTPQQFESFLSSPDELMPGGAGLSIIDRLKAMAEDGAVTRDPKWSPPASPSPSVPLTDASGAPIRNPIAYAASAKGNQDRATLDHAASLARVQSPKVDLPVVDTAPSLNPMMFEQAVADFRTKFGRDPDPTNLDDFNALFGTNEPARRSKVK